MNKIVVLASTRTDTHMHVYYLKVVFNIIVHSSKIGT